ncbi:MAG: ABC-ATPase domain-containing protein [Spirochaetales bacterium]|nr:ABC-ATPase domain-containing protein [Spirochaetales bacterium]
MEKLKARLQSMERKGYSSYKQLHGSYFFSSYNLVIDHVQSDPFAPPSAVRIIVPLEKTGIPSGYLANKIRRTATADFLSRVFSRNTVKYSGGTRGTGNSGDIRIDVGAQEVLERTCMVISENRIEARIHIGLPAFGRRVNAKDAASIFFDELPKIVESSLFIRHLDEGEIARHADVVEDQEILRTQLGEKGLVAFIENASILPRQSGISDKPMPGETAIPFTSPVSMEIEVTLKNRGPVRGMGIPSGVTLIVGGGYHGKSTLLKAIERGVYNHIPGDGREGVVTVIDAVKIRAEDGRSIECVDISPFISNLPFGRETDAFSTDNASGSTSQAANIIEAIEIGTSLLLIDEDTSATNFMVRDERMQALVVKEKEPITPFIDRVRELSEKSGISTIIVMGGSGDYFSVADNVVMMDGFRPIDVGDRVKAIVSDFPSGRKNEVTFAFRYPPDRIPQPEGFPSPRRGKPLKVQAKSRTHIRYENITIDLSSMEQLVDESQTRGIASSLVFAVRTLVDGKKTLAETVREIEGLLDRWGPDALCVAEYPWGDIARPRKNEIAAAVNRLRGIRMRRQLMPES